LTSGYFGGFLSGGMCLILVCVILAPTEIDDVFHFIDNPFIEKANLISVVLQRP
jgi:hypothetical protein